MSKDEQNLYFNESGAINREDRAALIQEARRRFAGDSVKMRSTIGFINAPRISLRQLRGLAKRWNMTIGEK